MAELDVPVRAMGGNTIKFGQDLDMLLEEIAEWLARATAWPWSACWLPSRRQFPSWIMGAARDVSTECSWADALGSP